jgi:tetratricopeptide (TPR) repeat protein
VAEPDLSGLPLGPAALEVARRVVAGEVEPAQGGNEIAGLWLPAGEAARDSGLNAMIVRAADWANDGHQVPSRRLAELTWQLAGTSGDESTAVWCAAALGQIMWTDPTATRRRLELLEYAVPHILASASPAPDQALILANLADARFNQGASGLAALQATAQACEDALAAGLDEHTGWPGRVHFIAGTVYQNIGDLDADGPGYQASIDHFQEALRCFPPDVAPSQRGSVLNNLGNTYVKLGARTGDAALLETAIRCFDEALPYRQERTQTLRTLRSRADAVRQLEEHRARTSAAASAGPAREGRPIATLLESGDAAYADFLEGGENHAAYLRFAKEQYVAGARMLGRDGPARQRGEIFHRMIRPFIESDDDDALWTGICFAAAARRVGANARPPIAQARSGFQLGFMLMNLGQGQELPCLRAAEQLLREVLPLLTADGEPGEGETAVGLHRTCLTLLAVNGDQGARPEALRLQAASQLERLEREAQDAPPDQLHAVYRGYLSLVRQEAAAELAALLAETELGYVQAAMDPALANEPTSIAVTAAAERRRAVGDLAGALDLADAAEKFARDAQPLGSQAWCELARFYAVIPMRDPAERCVQAARDALRILVIDVEPYLRDIDAVAALVTQDDAGPQLRPEATVAALRPGAADGRLRPVLEEFVRALGEAR